MHRFCLPQGGRLRFFVLWVWLLLGLLQAIEMKVEMINRMAHLTPVRTYRSAVASGVAIETEFQILNTLLAEKAAQLAVTENQLSRIFCQPLIAV